MRRIATGALLASLTLAACGGDTETKTVTVTRTVTKTVTGQAQAQTPASPAPEATPLPAGVVAADGTYAMHTRKSDYTGENTAVDDEFPTDSEWVFETVCQASACELRMRRELQSGAFKNVTLTPDPQREGVYVGTSSGTTGCAGDERSPTTQRYSVRLTAPEDVGGRSTARRMDVYFTEIARGCDLSDVARGVVSWRGSRKS